MKKALIGALACAAATVHDGHRARRDRGGRHADGISPAANMDTADTRSRDRTFRERTGHPAGLGDGQLEADDDRRRREGPTTGPPTTSGLRWPTSTIGSRTSRTRTTGPPHAAVSYQIQIDVDGTIGDGRRLHDARVRAVPEQGAVVSEASGSSWDVDSGQFWSTRTVGGRHGRARARRAASTIAGDESSCSPRTRVVLRHRREPRHGQPGLRPSRPTACQFNDDDVRLRAAPVSADLDGPVQEGWLADVHRPVVQEPGRLRELVRHQRRNGPAGSLTASAGGWPTRPPAGAARRGRSRRGRRRAPGSCRPSRSPSGGP